MGMVVDSGCSAQSVLDLFLMFRNPKTSKERKEAIQAARSAAAIPGTLAVGFGPLGLAAAAAVGVFYYFYDDDEASKRK